MFRSNLLMHKICVQKGMNSELDIVSDQLLVCLNDIIVCIQSQEQTLDNEIKNFQKLHDLYHDSGYARLSNKSSMNPSNKIRKESKVIYAYLMIILKQMHDRQKRLLQNVYQKQMMEELKHPRIETPQKLKLKTHFSRITLFIQRIETLFV